MSAVAVLPVGVDAYLGTLVERLEETVELEAAYLVGSAALGAFEEGASDLDVVAVTKSPLAVEEKGALVAAVEAIPVPARKLELVVYARGREQWEVNLNTGEKASFDPAEDPPFWFVLDRAIAEQHAVALLGPPWGELFPPVPRDAVLTALAQAADWHERNEPTTRSAVLNLCRSWAWIETGRWVSKGDAAAWLRDRVREAIEDAR